MILQFDILTGYLFMGQAGYNLAINPFYKRSKEYVLGNMDYAKECYSKILPHFEYSYYLKCFKNLENNNVIMPHLNEYNINELQIK